MHHLNNRRMQFVNLDEAVPLIQDGWLAQYRGTSPLSRLIQGATGGPHSHSALLRRNNGTVDVLEIHFMGGRAKPLESEARANSNCIDVFRPDTERWPEFNAQGAVEVMRTLTEQSYGYRALLGAALRKCPLIWRCFPIDTDDVLEATTWRRVRPYCSHAISLACGLGGGVDPVPWLPSYLVTPNHLTHSLLFQYRFTLVSTS